MLLALKMKKGPMSIDLQGMLPGTWKKQETDSLLEALEGVQPCQYLDFRSGKPISESNLQNSKSISVCCFKPSSLW